VKSLVANSRGGSRSTSPAAFVQNCQFALENCVNVFNNASTGPIATGLSLVPIMGARLTYYSSAEDRATTGRQKRTVHDSS